MEIFLYLMTITPQVAAAVVVDIQTVPTQVQVEALDMREHSRAVQDQVLRMTTL
jgi:hypothetical protein